MRPDSADELQLVGSAQEPDEAPKERSGVLSELSVTRRRGRVIAASLKLDVRRYCRSPPRFVIAGLRAKIPAARLV